MNKKFSTLLLLSFLSLSTLAREGMWLPILLDKNMKEMHEMGFQLTAKDLYDVNNSSIKDAVVLFGRGCTGEIISPEGLMITNHHCGFGQIQSHSTLENDYLTDGFWAMNKTEELPNEGLSVSILVEMRDVTDQILAGTDTIKDSFDFNSKIKENSTIVTDEAIDGTHYKARIKSFYNKNQYFLLIEEKFTDIRLVGAPPSAIGKFGGDTDNWMWPRHTGDFSMFRIYADSTNKPADYSPNNVPYKPKKFLPININGINEGDFTMVFGYPYQTTQNLHSEAVKQIIEQRDPDRIAIRDIKLDIMGKAMEKDPFTRIQYAAKYAGTANAWKKWQGEIKGLKRLNAVRIKKEKEDLFNAWVNSDENHITKYGNVMPQFDSLYQAIAAIQKTKDYYDESVSRGTDAYKMYSHLAKLKSEIETEKELKFIEKHFKDYNKQVDNEIFVALMVKYKTDIEDSLLSDHLVKTFKKKKPTNLLTKTYSKSILTDKQKLIELIKSNDQNYIANQLDKDKLVKFFDSFRDLYYNKITEKYNPLTKAINKNQTVYVSALMEMNKDKLIFPDANQTLRLSYGKMEGFVPGDGAKYKAYTTLDGIIEKDNPEIYDYDVPDRLKVLHQTKDYGRYANSKGELPVCFSASNHTTGGNSGSPVLDKNGYLVGINFDRCWEGTMSDVMFDPEKCRNISLDMRYMLFLIDKFAGASYLIDEMDIIKK